MSNTNYMPRPGSLAAHACAWFKVNPTRTLTLAEICGRWGGTAHTATAQLGAAEDAEFLLSERIGRSDVYSAGPRLGSWTPLVDSLVEAKSFKPPVADPEPRGGPAQTAKVVASTRSTPTAAANPNKRNRLPPLDLNRITVQTGTLVSPVRGGPAAKGQSQYTPLLDKLHPQSWVEVPTAYMPTLNKAIQKYRKAHPERALRCVKVSDEICHLQRLDDKAATPATKGQPQ
jgi:hypothetical protein